MRGDPIGIADIGRKEISEGVALQVSDIDSSRMMVHVRNGKGGKDRSTNCYK